VYDVQHVPSWKIKQVEAPAAAQPPSPSHPQQQHYHQPAAAASTQVVDLLDMGSGPSVEPPAPAAGRPPLVLRPCGGGSGASGDYTLTPQSFQKLWASLPNAFSGRLCVLNHLPAASAQIESLMASVHVSRITD
jgi:hypothetical protein